jgi:serine/threonine protein kinase
MSSPQHSTLPPDLRDAIGSACESFERAWKEGGRPVIEDRLVAVPEAARPLLAGELLRIELEYRCRRGEQPAVTEYRARFPAFAGALADWLARARAETGPWIAAQSTKTVYSDLPPPGQPPSGGSANGGGQAGRLGDYELLERLGAGGMGEVYKARQHGLNRLVALKRIRGDGAADADALARFRQEAEAVARLQHPHIVQIYAWGEQDGLPYFVLEYCPGGSLHDRLHGRPQPPAEAARLVEKLARAVQAAHDAGVLHRDLKPANVLLAPAGDEPALNTPWGVPKVADFGLCRLLQAERTRTAEGAVAGSPRYMAPEQAKGRMKEIGPTTDVWALGVILYEMLTGRPPFGGESVPAVLYAVCHEEASRPGELAAEVPAGLEAICLKCLRKRPEERYQRAADLAEALRGWLAEAPAGAARSMPPTESYRQATAEDSRQGRLAGIVTHPQGESYPRTAIENPRRWWVLCGVALLAFFAAAGAAVWTMWSGRPPEVPDAGAVAIEPLKGYVDLQIYDEHDPKRQDRFLGEPGVLPLRAGDQFCIRAELNRPAYLYVLWIDADGKVDLAYPRDPIAKSRPAEEHAVQKLRRPEALSKYYKIPEGTAGMETVVLLALEEKLPPEVDLRAELAGLPPQRRKGEAVVWFRDGEVVRDEPNRAPTWEETDVSDPLRMTQERLRQLWQRHGGHLRAVSFADRGR